MRPLDGSPWTEKPFDQSTSVNADVVVELPDQTKLKLLMDEEVAIVDVETL